MAEPIDDERERIVSNGLRVANVRRLLLEGPPPSEQDLDRAIDASTAIARWNREHPDRAITCLTCELAHRNGGACFEHDLGPKLTG